LQPPKKRISTSKPSVAGRSKARGTKSRLSSPAKSPRAKLASLTKLKSYNRRANLKEARRFTKESQVKKIFIRSMLAGIAALIVLVLATMFTPIMAISKITVTGNQQVPQKSIQTVLKKYIGSPLPMISSENVAQELAKFRLIESISLISLPPHQLQVRIVERTPIAVVIQGGVSYLYDPSGVRVGTASGYEKLPTIIIKDDPKNSKNFKQAIDVLLSLPSSLLNRVAYIQARSRDNVTLQLRGSAVQTIIWGDSTQSALKSRVLRVLLYKTPSKIRATFDVSAPLTPSVIR
jgi:cell division protein FtsQ